MKIVFISRVISNLVHLALSIILIVLSIHLIHLAVGHILNSFRIEDAVDEIFNALWLVTVALAVFDLAIILFDEIVWTGSRKYLKEFKWEFTKFLIVIITALLIETLVVFFRVAKKDVSLLIHPGMAIFAVCLLILALAFYMKASNASGREEPEDPFHILKLKYARGEIDKDEFRGKMEEITKFS
jgi:uncharacterized membrane protein